MLGLCPFLRPFQLSQKEGEVTPHTDCQFRTGLPPPANYQFLFSRMCKSLESGRKRHRRDPTIFSPRAKQLHTCILISNTITQSALLLSCSRRESRSLCRASPPHTWSAVIPTCRSQLCPIIQPVYSPSQFSHSLADCPSLPTWLCSTHLWADHTLFNQFSILISAPVNATDFCLLTRRFLPVLSTQS